MFSLSLSSDLSDVYFDQENDIEFLTKNIDQQPIITEPLPRRINAIFGDSKFENYYHKPQKITDEPLMNVSSYFWKSI